MGLATGQTRPSAPGPGVQKWAVAVNFLPSFHVFCLRSCSLVPRSCSSSNQFKVAIRMKRKYNAAKTRVKSFLYDRRREALQSRSQSPAPTDSHPDQVSPAPLVPLSYGAIRNEGLLPLLPMSRLSTQSELVENISLPRRPTDLESIPLKPPSRHTRRYSSDSSIREPKSVASTASSIVLAPFSVRICTVEPLASYLVVVAESALRPGIPLRC